MPMLSSFAGLSAIGRGQRSSFIGQPSVSNTANSNQNTGGATTVTFPAMSFGAAADDRRIIAAISVSATVSTPTVTIGGIPATVVANANGSNGKSCIAIASVPAGTAGDIVLTGGTYQRVVLSVFRVVDLLSSTTYHTATSINANPLTASVNIPVNGFAIAAAVDAGGQVGHTWTGLTEAYDVNIASQSNHSSASLSLAAGQVGRSVSCQPAGGDARGGMAIASWGNG